MVNIKLRGFDYAQAVVKGAAHLHVSECELFAIAYRGWFKQDADADEMQQYHMNFQAQGSLPHWVKHYIRQLDARTQFMTDDHPRKGTHCLGWLSRIIITILLPNSPNLIKQLQLSPKFSLYC